MVISQRSKMLALPGKLDDVPVFNSNSPEVVQNDGILLSTCTPDGKAHPEAHLNYPLKGRFDIFFHHISNAVLSGDQRTLYIGLIASNPSNHNRVIHILAASSYLSQPDAPFIKLPAVADSTSGYVYAGPGDRVMNDFLHEKFNPVWLRKIEVPDHSYAVIAALPIPVKGLKPPINGRSTLIKLQSDGPVRLACLAMRAKIDADGSEHIPDLADWSKEIEKGELAKPREAVATAPGTAGGVVFGRVAAVAIGSIWKGVLSDEDKGQQLHLRIGDRISFPISTVEQGTFGTKQIQSAPLVVRYADTAYAAHGNYGVRYSLKLPLLNVDAVEEVVDVKLQTPFKSDTKTGVLTFFERPPDRVFFRGSVRIRYDDDEGQKIDKYVHIVQNRGELGEPLVRMRLEPGEHKDVQLDLLYPPDSTPPQVLTITASPSPGGQVPED